MSPTDAQQRLAQLLETTLSDVRRHVDIRGPVLREADPPAEDDLLSIAMCAPDGTVCAAGDTDHVFPLQSVSKAFVYALVLEQYGIPAVLERVDVEPSGEAYDMLSLEEGSRRPDNPMINAGALTIHTMVGPDGADEPTRTGLVLDGLSRLAGRQLAINEELAAAEYADAHRNMAIAHMLRAERILPDEPMEVVRGYLRQCWIEVTVEDLARMAGTLATGGVRPGTEDRVVSPRVARHVLSVMTTCGMYDSAGDWMSEVGIPAKSGVSGAIMGAVPGRAGLAAYSPRLDPHGTSVRAQAVFEKLVDRFGLHLLDDPHGRGTLWDSLVEHD